MYIRNIFDTQRSYNGSFDSLTVNCLQLCKSEMEVLPLGPCSEIPAIPLCMAVHGWWTKSTPVEVFFGLRLLGNIRGSISPWAICYQHMSCHKFFSCWSCAMCIIFQYFIFQIGGFWVVFVGVGGFMIIISMCMCLFLPSNQGKSNGIKIITVVPAEGPFNE